MKFFIACLLTSVSLVRCMEQQQQPSVTPSGTSEALANEHLSAHDTSFTSLLLSIIPKPLIEDAYTKIGKQDTILIGSFQSMEYYLHSRRNVLKVIVYGTFDELVYPEASLVDRQKELLFGRLLLEYVKKRGPIQDNKNTVVLDYYTKADNLRKNTYHKEYNLDYTVFYDTKEELFPLLKKD